LKELTTKPRQSSRRPKERTSVIKKSVEGFGFQAHRELDDILILSSTAGIDWTSNSVRAQAAAFREFGLAKESQLLNSLNALCEEEDAQKKFERAKEEHQKWLKKMEMLEQAARILKEVDEG
jgi:hypothetical protein